MKKVLLAIIALSIAATAFASDLARVPSSLQFGGQPVQIFAPDGTTTTALAVTTKTVDMSNYIMFGLETGSGTTCYLRLMPTSAKGSYAQTLFRTAGTHVIRAVNQATPFVNFSGCTAGSYTLQ